MKPPAITIVLAPDAVHAVRASSQGVAGGVVCIERSAPATLFGEIDLEGLAGAIVHAVEEIGGKQGTVLLVVPVGWVFTHVLEASDKKITAQSLGFDFEQYLPVAVETLACGYTPFESGRVLAAGIPRAPVQQLLMLLAERGVAVKHLTVDALTIGLSADLAQRPAGLARYAVRSCEGSEFRPVYRQPNGNPSAETTETIAAIADAARRSIDKFDLCDDALSSGHRRGAVSVATLRCGRMVAALLALWAGILFSHTRVLRAQLAKVRTSELQCYGQVFEARVLPAAAALHLASERKRLEGLARSEAGAPEQQSDSQTVPLDQFREWVSGLPSDLRLVLTHARLDEKQWTLRGQTPSHRDAERVADTVGRVEGMQSRPPRTSRLNGGGVEFSILASQEGPQ